MKPDLPVWRSLLYVPVNVEKTIYDKKITDDRYPDKQHGAKFLAQMTTELGSNAPACFTVGSPVNWALSPNCVRALEYVRSRHGPGNNLFIMIRDPDDNLLEVSQRASLTGPLPDR